jgi:O-antigen/teichoic acid export membrane protein
MFHLGVSTIVTRSVVKNMHGGDTGKIAQQNTLALSFLASAVMALIVLIAGAILYTAIPAIYGQTYSDESVVLGQKIFVMFVAASVLHMLTDAFSGCVVGHERYVVSAAIPLFKTVGKCILQIVLLKCGLGVLFVVAVDLLIAAGVFAFTLFYAVCVLHEVPKLHYFDKKQLVEIVSFGMAILLQAFVNQVNNNMDTMILGAFVEEKAVITMYSSALAVYAIYNSLISVVTHYFLPQATRLTTQNASGREMTDFVIKPGRFQAIVAVACICGFALFGRNFISIWIGARYLDAYWVILMLMIPVTIPLVENAVISILDATMKRMYRSAVLVVMAVLNLITSVVLVQYFGFWGVAAGTTLSLLLGHGVLMNWYYAKVFRIEVFRMFRRIFAGILPAGLLASVICCPLALFLPDTVLWFVLKCVGFMAVYAVLLWIFGINSEEKAVISNVIRKLHHK